MNHLSGVIVRVTHTHHVKPARQRRTENANSAPLQRKSEKQRDREREALLSYAPGATVSAVNSPYAHLQRPLYICSHKLLARPMHAHSRLLYCCSLFIFGFFFFIFFLLYAQGLLGKLDGLTIGSIVYHLTAIRIIADAFSKLIEFQRGRDNEVYFCAGRKKKIIAMYI